MKASKDSKLKKYFLNTINSPYSQTISSLIFFIIFFYSLNYFYSEKMKFLNKNYIEIKQKIKLELSSPSVAEMTADSMNYKIFFNRKKFSNDSLITKIETLITKIETLITKIETHDFTLRDSLYIDRRLFLIPRFLIDNEQEVISAYTFKEETCKKFKIEPTRIFLLENGVYNIRFAISFKGLNNLEDHFL
jgi:hypothetical protein